MPDPTIPTRSGSPRTATDAAGQQRPGAIGKLRALASQLLNRLQLAQAAGVTFAGKRDTYKALGYDRSLDVKKYRDRFQRDPIANRIVSAFPKATWRGGGELIEDDDPETITQFEQDWIDFARRVRMWPTLQRTDVLAGLGRYAVLLIGAPGADLAVELPRGSSLEEIAYLAPFAEDDAEVAELETGPANPRYGQPKIYSLRRVSAAASTTMRGGGNNGATVRVHWTRVIHVADGLTDDNVYGQPRLQCVWNRLDDLDKVAGGGAEAFWLRAHPGYQINIDPEVDMEPEDEAALSDEIDEFEHGFRRSVRTRGVDMKTLAADVADISKPIDAIVALISAGTGIPKRILMGSERGELASSQDKNNFDQRVNDRRSEFAEPMVLIPLVDRMIEYGYSVDAAYEVSWPQEQDLNDQEKGALGKVWAGINKEMGDVVVTPDEIRDRVLGLPPLEDAVDPEELERLREGMKPPTPVPPGGDPDDDPDAPAGGGEDDAAADDDEDDDEDDDAARTARRVAVRPARGGPRAIADAETDLVRSYRHAKGDRRG